ncbi:MAG TPA: hypothetical protein VIM81_09665 [Gammaproteobacteria bacterium]
MQPCTIRALLIFLTAAIPTYGQEPSALANREPSFVAATRGFVFHSDATINLHDFLIWNARAEQPIDPRPDCVSDLPGAERQALEQAQEYYDQTFADPAANNRLLVALRYELAGFTDLSLVADEVMAPAFAELRAAAPAYRTCWWTEHDARNREWIAELVPRLIAHEDFLRARLSQLYEAELNARIPVDVVGYVSFGGANSLVAPDHLMISSVDPANKGDSALEVVFHEASHTLLGVERGAVWEALEEAVTTVGLEQLPRDLWHTVLFFTTGKAVEARLAERGVANYEPYVYREGLFDRAWPQFREPLEAHWEPYLEGRIDMAEAARRLLEELNEAQR